MPQPKQLLWALLLLVLAPTLWWCVKICSEPGDVHSEGCATSLLPSHEEYCSTGPGMMDDGGTTSASSGGMFGL